MRSTRPHGAVSYSAVLTRVNQQHVQSGGGDVAAYTDRYVSANSLVPSQRRLGRYQPSPLVSGDYRARPSLRDYQEEFVAAAWARYVMGQDRMLCVMPTGAGKTPTSGELMQALVEQWCHEEHAWSGLARPPEPAGTLWPQNLRSVARIGKHLVPPHGILAVAHRDYLIETLCHGLRATFGNDSVGILRGSAQHMRRPFIVASAQTLPEQLGKIDPMRFGLVVVDEAHHYVAGNQWVNFLIRLGFLSPTGEIQGVWPRCLIGMTATPERLTGKPLRSVFGPEGLVAPVDATTLWARPEKVIHKPDFIRLTINEDVNQMTGESLGAVVDHLL